MRHEHQTITSLPPSPDEERRGRMIQYLVMMGIRVACILMLPFLRGWWLLLPALGAIFLPYFAVVSANVVRRSSGAQVLRPGGVVRHGEDAGTVPPTGGPQGGGPERDARPDAGPRREHPGGDA